MLKSATLEWHSSKRKWSQNTVDRVLARLNRYVFSTVGHLSATGFRSRHFIELLKDIEEKGLLEVTSRSRQHLSNTMYYAIHQGLIETNPAISLDGVAVSPARRYYPTLSLERLPELLKRVDSYHQGRELTRLVALPTLHVLIHSSKLRYARWIEINFRSRTWATPTAREAIIGVRYSSRGVRIRTPHVVSLSRQIISILERVKEISGGYGLVFPSYHDPYKPMNENTIDRALRQIGYNTKQDICGYGFRTVACSVPMEPNLWSQDAVERQVSHQERNTVCLAYIHKIKRMEARVDVMQQWSGYLGMCNEIWVPPYIWNRQNIDLAVT